jgi:hypothetical protein
MGGRIGGVKVMVSTGAKIPTSHEQLARLMERELNYPEGHINPVALRLFIKAYWSRVSMLAHAIHEEGCDEPH